MSYLQLPANHSIALYLAVEQTEEGLFRATYAFDRFDYAAEIPLIILVGRDPNNSQIHGADNNSFSAAEAFSGAMQDYKRAIIIGEGRTGGKGSTSVFLPLDRGEKGALQITIGLWLTPNGRSVQGEDFDGDGYVDTGGLIPDILVKWTDEDYKQHNRNPAWDPVFFEAIKKLREP